MIDGFKEWINYRMKVRIFLFTFLIVYSTIVFSTVGQNPNVDSLKLLITTLPQDSTRVDALE
ncbi:MAG: hypothetical protein U5K79_15215 [Cyclobacteriaceae bacterium]|nr:hypothetical protein [Cyclobacteriaceae bacterium]